MQLLQPTKQTLERYGLSLEEWQAIASFQGNVCSVCRNLPKSGRLCIDHEHAKRMEENAS